MGREMTGSVIAIAGSVTDVTSSTGGRYIIELFDPLTANQISSIDAGEHVVEGLALSADGQFVAFSTGIGRLVIVNTQNLAIERIIAEGGFAEIGYPRFGRGSSLFAYFFGNTALVLDRSAQNREVLNLSDSLFDSPEQT